MKLITAEYNKKERRVYVAFVGKYLVFPIIYGTMTKKQAMDEVKKRLHELVDEL